jgi:beta-glucosidase
MMIDKSYLDSTLTLEQRVTILFEQMTLKEKIGQLNQRLYGWQTINYQDGSFEITSVLEDELEKWGSIGAIYGVLRADPWSGKNHENGIPYEQSGQALQKIQEYVTQSSRLGIPVLFSEECSHGHQALDSPVYPTNIGRGASWNLSLQEEVFKCIAEEMQFKGVHLGLISLFDILKDPRWGRSEECFGEDPYHTSRFAEHAINGFNSRNTTVIGKHFVAQGAAQGGHNAGPANIGYREMLEIHSYAVEHCLEATDLKGLMAAYNEIDGIPCHGNHWLLKTYLREQLNFDGIVMADGTGIDRLDKMTADLSESASLALNAGIDISLWDKSYEYIEETLENHPSLIGALNQSVKRILKLKFELGLFDQERQSVREEILEKQKRWIEVAQQSAEESIVLLKNNGILPLNKENWKKIVVIGPDGNSMYALLGDYVSHQRENSIQTIFEAIQAEFSCLAEVTYQKGCDILQKGLKECDFSIEELKSADLIIPVLGGSSERNFDMNFMGNGAVTSKGQNMDCGENVDVADIRLSESQRALFKEIIRAGKPIVTILIQGRPYVINEIVEYSDAVLTGWYPGMKGAVAIANTLVGKVNPSGKLPVTLPANSYQLPVFYNYRNSYAKQDYIDHTGKPAFSFGFGLSYSDFQYQGLSLSTDEISQGELRHGENITIKFDILNKSDISGKEVVQLYISRKNASAVPRVRELKQFKKIEIPSNSVRTIEFTLGFNELKVLKNDYEYDVEKSEIQVIIGTGSENYLSEKIKITN